MAQFATEILQASCVAILALVSYLARSYAARIHDDLKSLRSAIDKLDGRLTGLQAEIHRNTIELAVGRQEVKALWRAVDGAYERASDNGGSFHGED